MQSTDVSTKASSIPSSGLGGPASKPLLIYVNVPFCNSKCHFCDWVVQVPIRDLRLTAQAPGRSRHLAALQQQIRAHAPVLDADGYRPEIMYWGGGTASILTNPEIETVYAALSAEFDLQGITEATIEGSPESMNVDKLRLLHGLGFSRISIGVQSFEDSRLRMIGRAHSAHEAEKSINAARVAGFENVNIDLIVGFPDEAPGEVERTVRKAASLPVNHFSIYPYRASPGTVLRKQLNRRDTKINLRRQLDAYVLASDILQAAGFPEYAMSYFGSPRCRSDEAYYQLKMDWIGFGSGANSLINHRFLSNKRGRLHGYNENSTEFDVNVPAASSWVALYLLSQALTTAEGIDARTFQERIGVSLRSACEQPAVKSYLERMSAYGELIIDKTGIRLRRADIAPTYVALNWIDMPVAGEQASPE